MPLDPTQYANTPAYDLLTAAAQGSIGLDQRWIHALVDDPSGTLPDILRFAMEEHSEDTVNLEADLIAIFRHLRLSDALPFYIETLRRDPLDPPDELFEALVEVGQPALEPLLALYEELGEDIGGEVAFVLAGLRIRDPRILHLLIERLEYDAGEAAFLLEIYADPAGIPPIEAMAAQIQADDEFRNELLKNTEAIRAFQVSNIHSEFDIWELYPETAPPTLGALTQEERVDYLASPSPDYRAQAAYSFLNDEDYPDRVQARLLDLARNDTSPLVRGAAWAALIDIEDETIRREMRNALTDPSRPPSERAGAAIGMAHYAGEPELHKAIEELYEDREVRNRVLEAMWRSLEQDFLRFGAESLDDPSLSVQSQAILMVGALEAQSEAPRLIPFFEDWDVRDLAIHSYALAAPGETTAPRMRALFQKIDDLAKGLSENEREVVKSALDLRLDIHNRKPIFHPIEPEPDERPAVSAAKAGRNDPCPCGSGKKYKKCHGA